MFLYLKFYNSSKYYVQFAKHIPLFILLKLKLADAEKVKKSFISAILKGESKSKIDQKTQQFFEENFPKIFRQNALEFIEKIDRKNAESYLVTASLDIWVQPFADHFHFKLLATEAEFKDDIFTGNFSTSNCNGAEKVNRIRKATEGAKYDKTIAFGDTSGDRPMLNFAQESYYRFFH